MFYSPFPAERSYRSPCRNKADLVAANGVEITINTAITDFERYRVAGRFLTMA